MKENINLKIYLALLSFCPIFILIFIKYAGHWDLIGKFIAGLCKCDFSVVGLAIQNAALGDVIVTLFCIFWFLLTGVVILGFRDVQRINFDSEGESISHINEKKDSGVSFFVSFVFPLIINDVNTLRGFLFFVVLLCMLIILITKSGMFYQNPVLSILGYKVFSFKFSYGKTCIDCKKTYIGITQGDMLKDRDIIKRKYIADDVFLVYKNF